MCTNFAVIYICLFKYCDLFIAGLPPELRITSAIFTGPAIIDVEWEVCNPENTPGSESEIVAYTINYAKDVCDPDVLTINEVGNFDCYSDLSVSAFT